MTLGRQRDFRVVGILNATPDSFSDGGRYCDENSFEKRALELLTSCSVVDVGAVSTAPMNAPVSSEEEWTRFQNTLFPFLEKHGWPSDRILSIDTYRPLIYESIYHHVEQRVPGTRMWWNDVSGSLDEHVRRILNECPLTEAYVWCHALSGRGNEHHHMHVLRPETGESFVDTMADFFRMIEGEEWANFRGRIYFDPCFGFSKTREQNHDLLRFLPSLIARFPLSQKWMIGLSRKSFLRFPPDRDRRSAATAAQTDAVMAIALDHLIRQCPDHHLSLRVHGPEVACAALIAADQQLHPWRGAVSRICLCSPYRLEWSEFLSDVLELNVNQENDACLFLWRGISFQIQWESEGGGPSNGAVGFEFSLAEDDGRALYHRLEFLAYRKHYSLDLKGSEDDFSFSDPDGRSWRCKKL